MAEFCKQCAEGLGLPQDFEGLLTTDQAKAGLVVRVLCEGCGPTYVNADGECVSKFCYRKHRKEIQNG